MSFSVHPSATPKVGPKRGKFIIWATLKKLIPFPNKMKWFVIWIRFLRILPNPEPIVRFKSVYFLSLLFDFVYCFSRVDSWHPCAVVENGNASVRLAPLRFSPKLTTCEFRLAKKKTLEKWNLGFYVYLDGFLYKKSSVKLDTDCINTSNRLNKWSVYKQMEQMNIPLGLFCSGYL